MAAYYFPQKPEGKLRETLGANLSIDCGLHILPEVVEEAHNILRRLQKSRQAGRGGKIIVPDSA
jgi:hypothetical protein